MKALFFFFSRFRKWHAHKQEQFAEWSAQNGLVYKYLCGREITLFVPVGMLIVSSSTANWKVIEVQ